jgi:hypothetical protein
MDNEWFAMTDDQINRAIHEKIEGKCTHEWKKHVQNGYVYRICLKCKKYSQVYGLEDLEPSKPPDYLNDDAYCYQTMINAKMSVMWSVIDNEWSAQITEYNPRCQMCGQWSFKYYKAATPEEKPNRAILLALLKKKGVEND